MQPGLLQRLDYLLRGEAPEVLHAAGALDLDDEDEPELTVVTPLHSFDFCGETRDSPRGSLGGGQRSA